MYKRQQHYTTHEEVTSSQEQSNAHHAACINNAGSVARCAGCRADRGAAPVPAPSPACCLAQLEAARFPCAAPWEAGHRLRPASPAQRPLQGSATTQAARWPADCRGVARPACCCSPCTSCGSSAYCRLCCPQRRCPPCTRRAAFSRRQVKMQHIGLCVCVHEDVASQAARPARWVSAEATQTPRENEAKAQQPTADPSRAVCAKGGGAAGGWGRTLQRGGGRERSRCRRR